VTRASDRIAFATGAIPSLDGVRAIAVHAAEVVIALGSL
jgi:hypothetical protein